MQPTTRLWLMLLAIIPPGSTDSNRDPASRPPKPSKNHQGMPFWAVNTLVMGPRAAPNRSASGGRLWAFRVTNTTSEEPTTASWSVHSGCTVKSPSGLTTRSPWARIAARWGPRAMRVTSSPARARWAPSSPPVAPAPRTANFKLRSFRPERLGHESALDLARRGARDGVNNVEVAGHLEVRQPLAAEAEQGLLLDG